MGQQFWTALQNKSERNEDGTKENKVKKKLIRGKRKTRNENKTGLNEQRMDKHRGEKKANAGNRNTSWRNWKTSVDFWPPLLCDLSHLFVLDAFFQDSFPGASHPVCMMLRGETGLSFSPHLPHPEGAFGGLLGLETGPEGLHLEGSLDSLRRTLQSK